MKCSTSKHKTSIQTGSLLQKFQENRRIEHHSVIHKSPRTTNLAHESHHNESSEELRLSRMVLQQARQFKRQGHVDGDEAAAGHEDSLGAFRSGQLGSLQTIYDGSAASILPVKTQTVVAGFLDKCCVLFCLSTVDDVTNNVSRFARTEHKLQGSRVKKLVAHNWSCVTNWVCVVQSRVAAMSGLFTQVKLSYDLRQHKVPAQLTRMLNSFKEAAPSCWSEDECCNFLDNR